jgi:hypothetical protein
MAELHLEGFDGAIRSRRCLVIGKEADWLSRLAALESESLYRGRTVLVIQEAPRGSAHGVGGVSIPLLRRRWDIVFRVRESFEAQMLATYVANAPKPVRIVWYAVGAVEVPRVLWQKWQGQDVSLLGCSHQGEMMGCEWEAILFPLNASLAMIERTLALRGTNIRSLAAGIGEHLSDIAAKGAALVWSNIEEKDSRGALYWYDPTEDHQDGEKLSKKEAIAMLEEVVAWIGN